MKLPWKKILIFLGFLVFVILISYAIYYFFFRPAATREPQVYDQSQIALEPGELPQVINANVGVALPGGISGLPEIKGLTGEVSDVASGGLTKTHRLTSGEVKGVTIGTDGSLIYYDVVSGKFYRRLADGSVVELTDKIFHQVEKVTWSSSGNKAILEYPDGSNILYDFNSQKQYSLPKEMQNFAFSANDEKIATEVMGSTPESNWLTTSNLDGSNIKFIEQIGDRSDDIGIGFSPNNQVVATLRDNYDAERQEIYFIGQNKENLKSFIVPGRGFESKWTSDGNKMLYSVYSSSSNFVPTLWLTDAQSDNIGRNNISLNLNTWVDKCTINQSGRTAYCAVPRELPFGSGWYPELAKGQPDDFYRIDLETGRRDFLAVPSGSTIHSASQVFLSPDEKVLYFINQSDNNIYNINL
ncbi:hypothetical protein KKF32_02175 [Patescibacteria group bacterium]|nr:hypothetical protein [Patescibacteria group bacterium]